jgi:endonuclease-3 related protein
LMAKGTASLGEVYELMLGRYGPQHWWPADSWFEMMVGAVLTQSAAWTNVEKAIGNLKSADKLSAEAIRATPQDELAKLVYPSGYYNAKARKLKALVEYLGTTWADDIDAMTREDLVPLRSELLGVHGVGEETADDILLYALDKPVFVIDAYTRRLVDRLGLAPWEDRYSAYQALFMERLEPDAEMYGEYHALIVRHAKEVCRKKAPLCNGCVLQEVCPTGRGGGGLAQERKP